MTAALVATDVHKTYTRAFSRQGHVALRGLSLTVPTGSAFGLIGPNGAGKTTFIKTLLGITRPTSGKLELLGGDPDQPAVRARVGYLPERLHLPTSWTPPQFLRSVARLKGVASPDTEISRLLFRVGLTGDAHRRIGGFSKGMRQRVGLAAAFLGSPSLLVLDEPTDGVDPVGRVEIRNLLAEERGRGATLFLNSHLLAETERICDRVALLIKGRIAREGSLAELSRDSKRYRIRFAQPMPELTDLGFVRADDATVSLDAETPEALNAAIDGARSRGALLLELMPASRDLEAVLTDALKNPEGNSENLGAQPNRERESPQ